MGIREAVLQQLADGELHSGVELASALGRSRTAVWKQLQQLRALGLMVNAQPGRGYRLASPLELLDRAEILAALQPPARAALECLEVHAVLTSTSDRLRDGEPPQPGCYRAALAEYQSGGRGRRGRRWLSPFGSGLCLSLSWHFPTAPPSLTALGLAAGVVVHEALCATGAQGLALKWPNDVVAGNGKLAGLLVDMDGEAGGPITVVIGVGVNVESSADLSRAVVRDSGLPPVGLRSLVPARRVSRNALAADLIGRLWSGLTRFQETGFTDFAELWRRLDYLYGRPVTVQIGARSQQGTAAGIGADGALLLEENGEIKTVVSGEVSVRAVP